LPWTDDTGPVPRLTEAELLALTRTKADAAAQRSRRQLRALSAVAAVVLIFGLGAVIERRGNDRATQIQTTSGDMVQPPLLPETTSSVPPSTIAPTSTSASTTPTTVRTVTSPTTRRPGTTSSTATTAACRNSGEPACGPFLWDPPLPPNRPLTVKLSYLPTAPKVGETVTFSVTVDDPDGRMLLDRAGMANNYGDGPPERGPMAIVDCTERYGPWTPEAPIPVHADLTFRHVYAAAGTYTVSFPFKAIGNCTYGPSEATATATITVTP
jgi:hypothetical protein